MKSKTCPDCGCVVTPNNYKNHVGSKQCLLNQQEILYISWLQPNGKYQCPYCNKEYGKNGIGTHIWRNHGDGQNWTANNDAYKDGIRKGTNGFIKGTQVEHSDETKKKISELAKGREHTVETKIKQSNIRKKLFADGKISGWNRTYYYRKNKELGARKAILYVGLFIYNDIKFIKVGITEKTFNNRYKGKQYNHFTKELLYSVSLTNLTAAIQEQDILNKFKKDFNFIFPFNIIDKFDGYSECLSIDSLDYLKKELGF